jgi:hypothetical protein
MTTSRTKGGGKRTKRRGHKKMRGGMSSPSAHGFVPSVVGNGNQQWDNTFIRGGPFGGSIQNLAGTQPSVVAGAFPSAAQLKLIQSAGSRRRIGGVKTSSDSSSSSSFSSEEGKSSSGGKRTKRGGYWGKVLSQALVPFSLWFAQNKYGTRKHRGKK